MGSHLAPPGRMPGLGCWRPEKAGSSKPMCMPPPRDGSIRPGNPPPIPGGLYKCCCEARRGQAFDACVHLSKSVTDQGPRPSGALQRRLSVWWLA